MRFSIFLCAQMRKFDKKLNSLFSILEPQWWRAIRLQSKILWCRQDDRDMIDTSLESTDDYEATGILKIWIGSVIHEILSMLLWLNLDASKKGVADLGDFWVPQVFNFLISSEFGFQTTLRFEDLFFSQRFEFSLWSKSELGLDIFKVRLLCA